MMGLVLVGIVTFYIITVRDEKKKKKAKKPKVISTTLTDYELQPIEKQDMNYDEAVMYFNTARNSQRLCSSQIYDEKSSKMIFPNEKLDNSGIDLVERTIRDRRSKKITVGEHILDEGEF